jgi:hypothetical protein
LTRDNRHRCSEALGAAEEVEAQVRKEVAVGVAVVEEAEVTVVSIPTLSLSVLKRTLQTKTTSKSVALSVNVMSITRTNNPQRSRVSSQPRRKPNFSALLPIHLKCGAESRTSKRARPSDSQGA